MLRFLTVAPLMRKNAHAACKKSVNNILLKSCACAACAKLLELYGAAVTRASLSWEGVYSYLRVLLDELLLKSIGLVPSC